MSNKQSQLTEKRIEEEFHVSWFIVAYKFLFGLIEFLSGVGIATFGKNILSIYRLYVRQELMEEPHDLLIRFSEKVVPHILTHNGFILVYLILLGAAKMAGAVGLMYKQMWGVDLLIVLTVLLFPFQFITILFHPSFFNIFYLLTGLLIALYLVNFRPKEWAVRMVGNVRKKRN